MNIKYKTILFVILNVTLLNSDLSKFSNLLKWKAEMEKDKVIQELNDLMIKRIKGL